jgi:hypothetical protein
VFGVLATGTTDVRAQIVIIHQNRLWRFHTVSVSCRRSCEPADS